MDHETWQQREDILIRFEKASGADGLSLDAFLTQLSGDHMTISPDLLTELIRIDLELRWKNGEHVPVETYQARQPSIANPKYLRLLVDAEIEARRLTNTPCDAQTLRERFPDLAVTEFERWERKLCQTSSSTDRSQETNPDGELRRVPLQPGDAIGDYVLEAEIGRGSFATVWKARHNQLNRMVAIKVLSAHSESMPTAVERLQREARSIARINHPNIVQVYDVGRIDSAPFIVSQFIDGPTLREVLANNGLTQQETAHCIRDVARGLEEVHRQGIVHRDIKAANILMANRSHPMIVDFGLAQLEQEHDSSLTVEGDLIGTPAYMSPEQARGEVRTIDPRTDVYALGVLLYQSLAGRLPFEGKRDVVLHQIINERPTRLPNEVSRDLRIITFKCLEKSPTDRYATAAAVADDLSRHLEGTPILAQPPSLGERTWKWIVRRPRYAAALALMLVGTSFLLGTAWQLRRVTRERDKSVMLEQTAKAAQHRTQSLLAQTEADAGRIAMQRGQMSGAIQSFQKSLEMGHPDEREIRFAILESLVAQGDVHAAATAHQALFEDIHHDDADSHRLSLWKAELDLRSEVKLDDILGQLKSIDHDALSNADRAYCLGLISPSSLQSLAHYRQALSDDMFHHRARKCLIASLVSLGRLRDAESELVASQHLCPENDEYSLLLAVVYTSLGETEKGLQLLEKIQSSTDAKKWKQYCEFIEVTRQQRAEGETTSPFELLANDQSSQYRNLTQNRGFRLSLPIQQRFEAVRMRANELQDSPSANRDPKLLELLIELADSHPEASLWTLIGEMQLANNDIERAKDSFDRAIELPVVIPSQAREIAKRGVIATRLYLGLIKRSNVDENISRFLAIVPEVAPDTISSPSSCRAIVIALMQNGENELAQVWASRWCECSENSRDALWHLAMVERRLGNLSRSLQLWDEFLLQNPGHEGGLENRKAVLGLLRERIGLDAVPDAASSEAAAL